LDLLIANSSKNLSALLQLLKETGICVGEALARQFATHIAFKRQSCCHAEQASKKKRQNLPFKKRGSKKGPFEEFRFPSG
jgi:hypothetical protein